MKPSDPAPLGEKFVDAPLSGKLGAGAIVFMVVAAAAPLTAVAGLTPVAVLQGNGAGFPAMFIVMGIVLVLFAVGLCAMTPKIRESGGFYTYIRAGLGFQSGVGASFLAIFTYGVSQLAMYPFIGIQVSNFLAALNLQVPWWVVSLVLILVVGYLGYRNIDFSAKILGFFLVAEVVITLAVSVAIILHGGATGLSLATFKPSVAMSGNVPLGLMFAVSAFCGFESTTVYRDEAKNPGKTIPRATYIAVISVAVFYAFAIWAFVMGWGVNGVAAEATRTLANGDMYQQTAVRYVGVWLGIVVNVFLITSNLACILSQHNVVSRYLFTNARSGVLHARLGRQHSKHRSPAFASLAETAALLAISIVFILLRLDPYTQIYTWFSGVGVMGIVLLMAATSAAVVRFFARSRQEVSIWKWLVAPTLSGLFLAVLLVLIISNFDALTGDVDANGNPTFGLTTLLIVGSTLAAPLVGGSWGYVLLKRQKKVVLSVITDGKSEPETEIVE